MYRAHRAVIFAIAQLSCSILEIMCLTHCWCNFLCDPVYVYPVGERRIATAAEDVKKSLRTASYLGPPSEITVSK